MRTQMVRLGALSLAVVILAGCGGGADTGDRLGTVAVSGNATLDGKPFGPGVIEFISTAQGENVKTRNGLGQVQDGGAFVAGSYEEDDGLAPGEYMVHIMPDSADPNALHIPVAPFTVTISDAGTSELKVDLVSSQDAGGLDLLDSKLKTGKDSMNVSPNL